MQHGGCNTEYVQNTQGNTSLFFDYQSYTYSFDVEVLSEMYVKELLDGIPWEKCRYIIRRIVIEGLTEKEVASELQITQQAVNKWKKKGLEVLRQNLSNSYK